METKKEESNSEKKVVNLDVATSEVEMWLDYKKVGSKRRDAREDSIESLIDGVESGILKLNTDTKEWTQTMKFPIGEGGKITELKYKPRAGVAIIHRHLREVKEGDADGRLLAYIAVLTGVNKAILGKMDSEDFSLGQSISIFFI